MKLETRLRLESDFDTKIVVKVDAINAVDIRTEMEKYNSKVQELITYVRLQVSMAYKLGVKAGKGEHSE